MGIGIHTAVLGGLGTLYLGSLRLKKPQMLGTTICKYGNNIDCQFHYWYGDPIRNGVPLDRNKWSSLGLHNLLL